MHAGFRDRRVWGVLSSGDRLHGRYLQCTCGIFRLLEREWHLAGRSVSLRMICPLERLIGLLAFGALLGGCPRVATPDEGLPTDACETTCASDAGLDTLADSSAPGDVTCAPGETLCGSRCVSTATSPTDCGACGV